MMPTLIIALTAAAIFGLTPLSASLALGLAGVGPHALLAHTLTRRILGRPFVQAAIAVTTGLLNWIFDPETEAESSLKAEQSIR